MKSTSLLVAISALAASVVAFPGNIERNEPVCAANNCNRAVVGKPDKVAECAVYLLQTVTVVESTSIVTKTKYTIIGNDAYTAPATIPTGVPDYAIKACTSKIIDVAARYTSACSCAGVTASTTTIHPAIATTTTTSTVTVSSFKIAATASGIPSGSILISDDAPTSPNLYGILVASAPVGTGSETWTMTNGYLTDYVLRFSQQDANLAGKSQWIWTDYPSVIAANGWSYINFIIDPFTLAITAHATDSSNDVLQVCELSVGVWYLDLSASLGLDEILTGSKCRGVGLRAVL